MKNQSAVKTAATVALLALTIGVQAQGNNKEIRRPVQVSFVNHFGTNGQQADSIENNVSINLITGSSKGVNGMEIGTVCNFVNGKVKGFQAAGVSNHAKGSVAGAQIAGVLNTSKGITGFQSAGVANLNNGAVKGAQVAGVFNIARGNAYAQSSGVYNLADSVKGGQTSGVINQAQAVTGVQAAGVANIAKETKGVQMSGIINMSGTVKGAQLAGIVNKAHNVKGVQIGLINIADSCSGVPIGIVNIVKKGYHQFELGFDEMQMTSVAYRSGVKQLHTIIGASVKLNDMSPVIWGTTFGLGTSKNISPRCLADVELLYTHIICDDRFTDDNKLFSLYLGIDRHLGGKFSLSAGVTANALIYDTTNASNIINMEKFVPYTIISKKLNDRNHLAGWVGGRIALKIN